MKLLNQLKVGYAHEQFKARGQAIWQEGPAFEAGFRAAREMAAQFADDRLERMWGETDKIVVGIRLLGEEEV
jgi:hypothetical protein